VGFFHAEDDLPGIKVLKLRIVGYLTSFFPCFRFIAVISWSVELQVVSKQFLGGVAGVITQLLAPKRRFAV